MEDFWAMINILQIIFGFLTLIFIDIILSLDNAVLIASATKSLPNKQRKIAEVIGAIGAMIFRLIFVVLVVWILESLGDKIPLIYIIGGLILIYLGLTLTKENNKKIKENKPSKNIMKAIILIIIGDLMMSLDNAIILGGIVEDTMRNSLILEILAVGITLIVSLAIIVFFSDFLGKLMNKYKFISYIAAIILVVVGLELMQSDILLNAKYLGVSEYDISLIQYLLYISNVPQNLLKFLELIIFCFIGFLLSLLKYFLDKKNRKKEKHLKESKEWINDFYNKIK